MFDQEKNTSNHFLFETLNQEEKKLLGSDIEHGHTLPRQLLYENDRKLKHIYLIRKGIALVGRNYLGNNGNTTATLFAIESHFLGIESLLVSPNNEYVKALSNVYFSKVSFDVFFYLLRTNLQFQDTARKQMANRLQRLEGKYNLQHYNASLLDRIKFFFMNLVQLYEGNEKDEIVVDIQITHLEISRYLQCSRQFVTTALNNLRQRGYIDYDRTFIKIIDLKKIIDWKLS